MIKVDLRSEGIVKFYDRIAELQGYDSSKCQYDCTKILVSPERFDILGEGIDKETFAMMWVCCGPKVDERLSGEEVITEKGFIEEVER